MKHHPTWTSIVRKTKTVLAAGLLGAGTALLLAQPAAAAVGKPEKWELKFGFIKLTDMAPLAVAY
jgi:nitrate/nitrite transport system substrate-binding protein